MQHEGIIMVWIVVRLISDLNHPLRLLMGEVYHVEFAEIAETLNARYLWLNVFLPTEMFWVPVYHIPSSAQRTENWKQPDIYLWI